MKSGIQKWLNSPYPQNYIIRSPFNGALIIAIFCFGFAALYRPLNTHAARSLSFDATMAAYCFLSGVFVFLSIKVLKRVGYFSSIKDWTILRELLSVFIVLFFLGIAIYILGFFIEVAPPGSRLNIATLLNSFKGAFLTGIFPLIFFASINYRYLFVQTIKYNEENSTEAGLNNQPVENLLKISSQLKKEELSFYPSQFLYAESDGNYVVFYLNRNNVIKKEIIRNSINSIEEQLSGIPYVLRTHRAFIVNLKKVRSKQGNTLGYLVKLSDTENKIPVSRNNTRVFNELLTQYHS